MNILFVGVECYPFIKVGGLGDILGSLPSELIKLGNDVRVIMPKYSLINEDLIKDAELVKKFTVYLSTKPQKVSLYRLLFDGVTYYFIESEKYYAREKVYNYPDEEERWALFQIASVEAMKFMNDFKVDIIHCHDWHTGMIPHLIRSKYYQEYGNIKTIFTIHNVMYQGEYERQSVKLFNIPFESILEHNGKLNFMKSAIVEADYVTTVSETYAKELMSEYFSEGLYQYFRLRKNDFTGIINGIDYKVFNPEIDEMLPLKYNFSSYKEGKLEAKKALYEKLGVDFYTNVPMIGIVSRLTKQKGIDLIMEVIEALLHDYTFKFILIGSGEKIYEDFFKDLEKKHPYKVKCYLGYSDYLAHLVYAASDMFLMPSAFEPCGLGQMIALKYGSLPIVRETGGLKDSVNPYNEYELTGNGFSFTDFNAHDMMYVIKYAFRTYNQPTCWDVLVQNAMASDFSFTQSAKKYNVLYHKIVPEE